MNFAAVFAWVLVALNLAGLAGLTWIYWLPQRSGSAMRVNNGLKAFFIYELLIAGAFVMLLPFYWMFVTSFKDSQTAVSFPPEWLPTRMQYDYKTEDGKTIDIQLMGVQRKRGDLVPAVAREDLEFRQVDMGDFTVTRLEAREGAERFMVDPDPTKLPQSLVFNVDPMNFIKAWYRPEESTRGAVNFGGYFLVSLLSGVLSTIGTLATGALAAFAFAKMKFFGKDAFFYVVLITMMVPGQVLLIPSFLILGWLGWLDTYLALIVPFLASVFTIFLMRQFFMTVPDDLWDAAQIDGAGRFRFLWQIVTPLSKPVYITAGIFVFLGNWNSLLWPLIVTSRPEMRTLMVGLQSFNEEAGSEFELLMAASTMAIFPVVIMFFVLQRFFIQGIARTGLK